MADIKNFRMHFVYMSIYRSNTLYFGVFQIVDFTKQLPCIRLDPGMLNW